MRSTDNGKINFFSYQSIFLERLTPDIEYQYVQQKKGNKVTIF